MFYADLWKHSINCVPWALVILFRMWLLYEKVFVFFSFLKINWMAAMVMLFCIFYIFVLNKRSTIHSKTHLPSLHTQKMEGKNNNIILTSNGEMSSIYIMYSILLLSSNQQQGNKHRWVSINANETRAYKSQVNPKMK